MEEGREQYVADLSGTGKVMYHYAPYAPEIGIDPGVPKSHRTSAALQVLRPKVDAARALKEMPHPVKPERRRGPERRKVKDVFYGKEALKALYMRDLKKALERNEGADLYNFLMGHQEYGKGDAARWNQDFSDYVTIPLQDGEDQTTHNRRIIVAAKLMLVDYFKNGDIFQATLSKGQKRNPWISMEDGNMGPYAVSLLADYWMLEHGKKPKNSILPPPRDAKLIGFKEDGSGFKTYEGALAYKATQVIRSRGRKVEVAGPPTADTVAEQNYAALDRGPEGLDLRVIHVLTKEMGNEPNLPQALAAAFKETANPDDPGKAPKTYRVMRLLAEKKGDAVAKIVVKAGDLLTISDAGAVTIIRNEGDPPKPKEVLTAAIDLSKEKKALGKDPNSVARVLYAKYDQSPHLKLEDLAVEQKFDENVPQNLSTALAIAYGERVGNGIKSSEAPKTFRVLHLVADRIGIQMETRDAIQKDDVLKITKKGLLTITSSDGNAIREPFEVDLAKEPKKNPAKADPSGGAGAKEPTETE